MFLIIFDEKLQRDVIIAMDKDNALIKKMYESVKEWIETIYLKDYDLPAKFASKVFIGDFWDFAMEVRVPAALFQILIDILKVPLWVSWADMELGSDIIRLVILYSSSSKVSGIPGKVVVAQFSDDDRVIKMTDPKSNKKTAISTLFGGVAILYTIKTKYMKEKVNVNEILEKYNKKVSEIINEIEKSEEESALTDLETEFTQGGSEING